MITIVNCYFSFFWELLFGSLGPETVPLRWQDIYNCLSLECHLLITGDDWFSLSQDIYINHTKFIFSLTSVCAETKKNEIKRMP